MATDDVTNLRELAEAINGIRPMPFASADLCRRVANEMELANARIDRLLDGLRKANEALTEATKAGTPYWLERDTMNGLILDNQRLRRERDEMAE